MPVLSKISRPTSGSDGGNRSPPFREKSRYDRSPSPLPDRKSRSVYPGDKPDISGSTSGYTRISRASDSKSHYKRNSHPTGPISDTGHHHSRVSTSRKNQRRSRSYTSDDDSDDETTGKAALLAEIDRLNLALERSEGRSEALSCVPVSSYYVHTIHMSASIAYNDLLDRLGQKVDKTNDKVDILVRHASGDRTGEISRAEADGIPLNPKQENYKGVRHWKQAPWLAAQRKSSSKDSDSPIYSLFWEDEFGNVVSDEVKEAVRDDLYGYWTDVHKECKKLTPRESLGELTRYKDLGYKRKEDFRKIMEGKYPWLRLCAGHWKVKRLWMNHFRSWQKANFPTLPSDDQPANPDDTKPKGATPINISSDDSEDDTPNDLEDMGPIEISSDGDGSPTGSKRRRDETAEADSSPPKKHKGKGKAIDTSNFHPPRPVKKIKAKVAKASYHYPHLSDAY